MDYHDAEPKTGQQQSDRSCNGDVLPLTVVLECKFTDKNQRRYNLSLRTTSSWLKAIQCSYVGNSKVGFATTEKCPLWPVTNNAAHCQKLHTDQEQGSSAAAHSTDDVAVQWMTACSS